MKTKKQPKKTSKAHTTGHSAQENKKQPETPATQRDSQPTVVGPPLVSTDQKEAEKVSAPKKEKAPSISASVRKIIVKHPAFTAAEVSQNLIDNGWDAADVEKRASTIATLRTDALAIIAIAKEEGYWK